MNDPSGTLVKLARLRSGLSQRELAHRAGTSQPTLAAYESGRKAPTLKTLMRVLDAAGFELRFRLEPADAHDDWIRAYEERLPAAVLNKIRDDDRRRIARAKVRKRASVGKAREGATGAKL
jgi:transcriptional regulator with XRE-family HTH domain